MSDSTSHPSTADDAIDMLTRVRANQRGRWLTVLGAFVLGATTGALALSAYNSRSTVSTGDNEAKSPTATVEVEMRDLATYIEYDGDLGYSLAQSVTATTSGTLTERPETGADLARGDVLYSVDTVPVVLFYGEFPLWRDLDIYEADGRDILQLEANLWALGYTADTGDGPNLTVDGDFDRATAVAVEAWEIDLGLEDPDGAFAMSSVVVLSGPIRVDEPIAPGVITTPATVIFTGAVQQRVTDLIDEDAHTVTGQDSTATELVTLEVSAEEQEIFVTGSPVEIGLSDGRVGSGEITAVSETARRSTTGQGFVVDVEISIVAVPDGGLIEGPVTVRLVDQAATDAVAVPTRALLALAEGGYAVEVDSGGTMSLVGVETGLFADGWVEVAGDVSAGDLVVVPS